MTTIIKSILAFAALFVLAIVYWTAIAMSWLLLPIVKLGFAFAAAPRYIKRTACRIGELADGDERRPVQPDIWCD